LLWHNVELGGFGLWGGVKLQPVGPAPNQSFAIGAVQNKIGGPNLSLLHPVVGVRGVIDELWILPEPHLPISDAGAHDRPVRAELDRLHLLSKVLDVALQVAAGNFPDTNGRRVAS